MPVNLGGLPVPYTAPPSLLVAVPLHHPAEDILYSLALGLVLWYLCLCWVLLPAIWK